MEKIILIFLFSISKWQCLHNEVTDNGFLTTSAPDSMTSYLFGVRDDVGGIIFKTTNGGENWQELQPWTIDEVFLPFGSYFLNQNTGFITAEGLIWSILPVAKILKTTDGGNTWQTVYGGTLFEAGKLWEDIFFLPSNTSLGWACGAKGDILKTTNGGSSWSIQTTDTLYPLKAIYFINSQEGWCVGGDYDTITYEGINGVILKTTNGGTTWTAIIDSAPFELWDVHFIDNQKGIAVGYKNATSYGLILKTYDGGNSWIETYGPPNDVGYYGLFGVEFVDNLRGFAVGGGNKYNSQGMHFGIFLKTEDGGNTWLIDTIMSDVNQPWGVAPLSLDMVSKNWGYAGGSRMSVFRYSPLSNVSEKNFTFNNMIIQTIQKEKIQFPFKNFSEFKIFDISGRILNKGNGERLIYNPNKNGIYYVNVKNKDKEVKKKIILIR
jgi:photosystem II stability/assembly factor-like uncharacterized protein